MSSELINNNKMMFSRLSLLSCEMFKGTLGYKDAKNFVEQHSKKNEKFAFLINDEESELINGSAVISRLMSSTSIEHSYIPYYFACLDGKDYTVIKYYEPKSQKTTRKLY